MAMRSIKRIDVPTSVWTPILATIDCNYFSWRVPVAGRVRQDALDSTTEDELPANIQETDIASKPFYPNPYPKRYKAGEVLFYYQPDSVSSTGILRCLE